MGILNNTGTMMQRSCLPDSLSGSMRSYLQTVALDIFANLAGMLLLMITTSATL
jgi:hypothetical protein